MLIRSRLTRPVLVVVFAVLLFSPNSVSGVFASGSAADSNNSPAGLEPGSTVRHRVAPGEWLMQIARCYGADYEEVRRANPQISNPSRIWTGQVVRVPNIGSQGTIYGPPCVLIHTAAADDSWGSLAEQYNARLNILKRANPVRLDPGVRIRIPVNSAGGAAYQEPRQPLIATSKLERAAEFLGSSRAYEVWTDLCVFNGFLYFFGDDGDILGTYNFDGSVVNFTGVGAFGPGDCAVYNGDLYYHGVDFSEYGYELWKFDGTVETLAADIAPGRDDSGPSHLTVFKDELYFSADAADGTGDKLWKFDGVDASLVLDSVNAPNVSSPRHLVVFNDELYFSAKGDDGAGWELWKYDGTRASLAADINPGPASSSPRSLAVYNGALYFAANGGDGAGTELWKFDSGTVSRVADLIPGPDGSYPDYLTVYKGRLYFSLDNGDGGGDDLWAFDGSTAELGADIFSDPDDAAVWGLTVYNGGLYFVVDSDTVYRELWRYTNTAP